MPDSKLTPIFCCLDVPQLISFAVIFPQFLKRNRKGVSFINRLDGSQILGILPFFFYRNQVWNARILLSIDGMFATHSFEVNIITMEFNLKNPQFQRRYVLINSLASF